MVAQLDEMSMQFVVEGADGRSCGLLGCYFAPRRNSYCHKRHTKLRQERQPVDDVVILVWDFVFVRSDGTVVRLHPQRSTAKVETFEVEGTAVAVQPPAAGKGGSDGRGTYRYYKESQTRAHLTFDTLKGKGLPPFKCQ
jgi:hypothetical protein